jgi:hypothetical protein
MITIKHHGNFKRTEGMFKRMTKFEIRSILNKYGKKGVDALAAATPKDTGRTADSWEYEVSKTGTGYSISWNNRNVNNGVNIALILQLGHGTGTGGYVQGVDYINPALASIFEQMADEAWQEVSKV